jgi:hypothetical protein
MARRKAQQERGLLRHLARLHSHAAVDASPRGERQEIVGQVGPAWHPIGSSIQRKWSGWELWAQKVRRAPIRMAFFRAQARLSRSCLLIDLIF